METIFIIIVLLYSVIIHEISHGYAARMQGDPTAEQAGRLTLNPLPHLDPIGSILLPLMMLLVSGGRGPIFGWAKPVPYNPYNLRNHRWGPVWVALAGPGVNFAIALFFGLAIRLLSLPSSLTGLFGDIVLLNIGLAIFNLIPIPPLDGSKLLLALIPEKSAEISMFLQQYGFILIILIVFFGFQFLTPIIFSLFSLFAGRPLGF